MFSRLPALVLLFIGLIALGAMPTTHAEYYYRPDTASTTLYDAPHAVWLTRSPESRSSNMAEVTQHLILAKRQKRAPLFVTYFIPNRDLGQASEGGVNDITAYMNEHEKLRREMVEFKRQTGLTPRVILEPDALAQAWSALKATPDNEYLNTLFHERLSILRNVTTAYHIAGIPVYLDAGHSQWFIGKGGIDNLTDILLEAGAEYAVGFTSNISNRQWATGNLSGYNAPWFKPWKDDPYTAPQTNEYDFSRTVLQALQAKTPTKTHQWEWLVDVSRSGGNPKARAYTLRKDGQITTTLDGEILTIGPWRREADGRVWLYPFFGASSTITGLAQAQGYVWDESTLTLTAPIWLDPIYELRAKIKPSDISKQTSSANYEGQYLKPADECDGALGLPPGDSYSRLRGAYQKLQ